MLLRGSLENFFYEVSSYLSPGVVLLTFLVISSDRYHFKDFSILHWFGFVFISYLLGMLVAASSFYIFDKNRSKYFCWFNHYWGIYRILSINHDKCDKSKLKGNLKLSLKIYDYSTSLKSIYSDVLVLLNEAIFGPKVHRYDKYINSDNIKDYLGVIGGVLPIYINQKTSSANSRGRYYERICLARNLALVLFVILLLLLIPFVDCGNFDIAQDYYKLILLLFAILVLMAYSRLQSLWYAEYLLHQLIVISRVRNT